MVNFHDVQLPKFIGVFAFEMPEFSTSHSRTMSGREIRHQNYTDICQKYLIKNCLLSNIEFIQFGDFFKARKGSSIAFRFRDYIVRFRGDSFDYSYADDGSIALSEIGLTEVNI